MNANQPLEPGLLQHGQSLRPGLDGRYSVGSGDPTTQDIFVMCGDSLTMLRALAAGSVDAVVCDPPYAIKAGSDVRQGLARPIGDPGTGCTDCVADSAIAGLTVCARCLRDREVASFADAAMLGQQSANWHERATHSRGYADNDPAAFQRWCGLWLAECLRVLKPGGHLVAFGGTRTWHRMATAAEDEGFQIRDSLAWLYGTGFPKSVDAASVVAKAVACTGAAATQDWAGWGTALKPGHEPIVFARKPLHGTVAANLVTHEVGALNIDACRIVSADEDQGIGRWPTNVFLDQSQGEALDVAGLPGRPSRFFWVAKPSSAERVVVDGVAHPTVKPLALMRELVRLVTPPDGVVLDPFAGSGTTVEACIIEDRRCIAIEKNPAYLPLIQQRIARQTESVPKPGTSQGSNPVSDPGLEPMTLFSLLPDAS